ncbi:MAG: DUF1801 domain-containing protein [Burkholderiales bacterium]|nr:MAG: DUF1801 domain-containing protein [Betaproteobacteria bacterium]TAG83956.1 MAG: DUF1801 domain-containing protein [Burkholderiales bacterium]
MAENKTKATAADVSAHIAALENEQQRADCTELVALFRKVTKHAPTMWGTSIIGFGSCHYKYESGREGDMCATGFAARKNELVVYLVASSANQDELLGRLGKHKRGKSCLYFKKLADIDINVLEALIRESLVALKARYPTT